MVVKVSKPEINVREKISELDKPSGVAGQAMLAAETPQEQFNLIGAGRRNMVINGAMVFSQRNGTSAVTLNSWGSVLYEFDRWRRQVQQNGKLTLQQVTDAPVGFGYSIKATTASAISQNTGADYYMLNQLIEGFDTAHLAFGTSSAKTITLSFWVKSTLTGQWSGAVKNSGSNRAYVFTYDINFANTWEYKTVTIPGDTSGTWIGATNGIGLSLMYDLGTARADLNGASNAWSSTNAYAASTGVRLVQNAGATWQITGVQLEVGKVATPFEHRSYGEELALCQRYYQKFPGPLQIPAYQDGSTGVNASLKLSPNMRSTTPSIATDGSVYLWRHNGFQSQNNPAITPSSISGSNITLSVGGYSGGANGYVANLYISNLEVSNEL